MGFLDSFHRFAQWLIKAIPNLIAKNRELREEIRSVIGELTDDLAAGLELVRHRLKAAGRIKDGGELVAYLSNSKNKLYGSFSEFRVCEDIRNLEDRFNRIFDPTRGAVEMGHAKEVAALIANLEDHERLVFDMIEQTFSAIDQAVLAIEAGGAPRKALKAGERERLDRLIRDAIEDCDRKREEVKTIGRSIIDALK